VGCVGEGRCWEGGIVDAVLIAIFLSCTYVYFSAIYLFGTPLPVKPFSARRAWSEGL